MSVLPLLYPTHTLKIISKALEKSSMEEEKPEADDNTRTIRPSRSPSMNGSLPRPSTSMSPIVEDYSDLAGEEEELHLQAKVADFKVRSPVHSPGNILNFI